MAAHYYVAQHIQTGDYVEASDRKDITTARLFNSTRAAHSCRSYDPSVHALIEVVVVPVDGVLIRNGEWKTEKEIEDQYGSIGYYEGDEANYAGSSNIVTIVRPPHGAPAETYQVKGKKIFQAVWYTTTYWNNHTSKKIVQVWPTKETVTR